MTDHKRRFTRRTEDFICLHCGEAVRGDGYTNHCPVCLWSRHVDNSPGDRAAECRNLMYPLRTRLDGKKSFVILHRCEACGHEKWNRAGDADNRDEIALLLGG